MKVVNKENFPHVFPMRIKCEFSKDANGYSYGKEKDFCGSELEVEAKDIKKHNYHKYPNISGIDFGVKCPVCKQFIVIGGDMIPEKIKRNAKETYLT